MQLKGSDFFAFGYFGLQSGQLDGQTIKTRSIHRLFEEKLGQEVPFYDTETLKKHKLGLLAAILSLIKAKYVIYLPAGRSLKKFFPVLFVLSALFNFRLLYFVVGGWLPKLLLTEVSLKNKLKKIAAIYVETNLMRDNLKKEFDFQNVTVFPNFRFNENRNQEEVRSSEDSFRIVYMSRINKKKGIDFIFSYAGLAPKNVLIDFYGPIAEEDRDYFELSIKNLPRVSYQGILAPEHIHNTLSKYDLLVLPTQYYTEGLPGAIVDAYFAGIPVVVTKWQYAEEFVIDGQTGFIVPFENGYEKFAGRINQLIDDKELLSKMKQNSKAYSQRFTADHAWKIIINNIE